MSAQFLRQWPRCRRADLAMREPPTEPRATALRATRGMRRDRLLRRTPVAPKIFHGVVDAVVLIEVIEKAAHGIARREQRLGPLEHLEGYAWVTLRTAAVSRLRRSAARLAERTMASEDGNALLGASRASTHTAQSVEQRVFLKQVLAMMTRHNRRILILKEAGFSTAEIARRLRRSPASIDTACSRARAQARRAAGRG